MSNKLPVRIEVTDHTPERKCLLLRGRKRNEMKIKEGKYEENTTIDRKVSKM